MRIYFWLILCCLFPAEVAAQVLKGKITNGDNEPVPSASIYIRETAQGIMADDKGEFRVPLDEGNYTCDFSSLGYERKTLPVTVGAGENELNVRLDEKAYALKEVRVFARGEDPAYAIMRRAIGMAPFYLNQVKRYTSEVYLKGTLKVEKLPRLLKLQIDDVELEKVTNKLFVVESQSEVTFTAPDQYDQQVKALSSTIPAEADMSEALEVMTGSIYQPDAFGKISPLAPGAFSYYKFTLEGVSMEGDRLVSKIRVQPKKKNGKLVTGWLYIMDNTWNVYRADLISTEFGVTVHFLASYNEVMPDVFLPTTYDMDVKIDLMGVKAGGKYYSSVQYKEVEVNENTHLQAVAPAKTAPATAPKEAAPKKTPAPKQAKAQKEIERLSAKDELSDREAYKLAKLMQRASEPEKQKDEKPSYELKPFGSEVKIKVDTLASKRDSAYWAAIRNLPLRPEELASYRQKDSLKLRTDSLQHKDSLHRRTPGYWIGEIFTGHRFTFKKKYSFEYSGLLRAVPEYNFVDGFWIGQQFKFAFRQDEHRLWNLSPSVYYTTARKELNWYVPLAFQYAPMRNGLLLLSGGSTTADYDGNGSMLRIINSFSSLFFAENPLKFYKKNFVEARHSIDLANGLILKTGLSYAYREGLPNYASYSFFGKEPSPNYPYGDGYMESNKALKADIAVEYTPAHYYWKYGERKRYVRSKYPTLSLHYQQAIPLGDDRSASYNMAELTVRQEINLGMFDRITYRINAGKFFNTDRVYLPDFKHFEVNELFITGKRLESSFSLLDTYAYSNSRQWVQAHFTYTAAYLLVKQLPFLQKYMFDEALHARTVWLPDVSKAYTEAGYSLGITSVGRVGVFVGFEGTEYKSVGFTVSLPFLNFLEHK